MYTKCIQREVTISMAAKKTRKRKTSSAKKRTRTRQKDFAPFYKEIAVLVVFALFIFLFLSNFGICGYIGNSISTFSLERLERLIHHSGGKLYSGNFIDLQ